MRNFDVDGGTGGGFGSTAGSSGLLDLAPGIAGPGFIMSFSRNEEIYGEDEPTDFVYRVISGAVRITRTLSDGRRQIAAFQFGGDVFGLDPEPVHAMCAEAISECRIMLIKRAALERAADRDASVARALWSVTALDLKRLREHMLLLARKGALERLSVFLLELSERAGGRAHFELPMSRTDIADYLGLTIETVSRGFTQLEREGTIDLPSCRRVEIRDRASLENWAG